MSDTKSTVAAIIIALLLSASLLLQLGQLRATNFVLGRLNVIEERTPKIPASYEYQVLSIGDAEWGSTAGAYGQAGWEIVSARRASDSEDHYAYECIMRRMMD